MTWYGDMLEDLAPKAAGVVGGIAGGAAGTAIGTAVAPGAGTAPGASIGAAVGAAGASKLTSHAVKWLRKKYGFSVGGVIHTTGNDAVAIVHNGEMVIRQKEVEAVKKLMREHGIGIPKGKVLPPANF